MKKILFCLTLLLLLTGCECPYLWEKKNAASKSSGILHADRLPGLWQCYYPMIITGVEFKEIRMFSDGKADIVMEKVGGSSYYMETFSYAFDGEWLRFTGSRFNYAFQVTGYVFPELYLRDSFGEYVIAFRKTEDCITKY